MNNSRLNTMGLKLSNLSIGCEPLGNTDWGFVDIPEAKFAINEAFEYGINTFDIADVYGLGQGEKELSMALGKHRHDSFIISKFGVRWKGDGVTSRAITYIDNSPDYVNSALENSLRRLRLEIIPLYLIHWPDNKSNIFETLNILEKARKDGKILNYGLSNFDISVLEKVVDEFPIAAIETSYSLIINNLETVKLLDFAKNKGLATFTYGPLAQGLLSGKYNDQIKFTINDRRHRLEHFSKESLKEKQNLFEGIKKIARKYDKTMAQVALRWVIDSYYVTSAIVGIKNRKQLQSNLEVLNWSMDMSDWQFLDQLYKSK